MRLKQFLQIAALFCLFASNLACAAMFDSGGTNAPGFGNRLLSDPNTGRTIYDTTAVTRDGRRVYLANGTWEFAPNVGLGAQDLPARLSNGRLVSLHSDGTWSYSNNTNTNTGTRNRNFAPKPGYLYLYQKDGGFGRATVYLDNAPIAHLRENRYFKIRLTPGMHTLNIAKQNQGTYNIKVVPGREYYVKNCECFDGWGERLKVMAISEAKAEMAKAKVLNSADVINYEIIVEPRMY